MHTNAFLKLPNCAKDAFFYFCFLWHILYCDKVAKKARQTAVGCSIFRAVQDIYTIWNSEAFKVSSCWEQREPYHQTHCTKLISSCIACCTKKKWKKTYMYIRVIQKCLRCPAMLHKMLRTFLLESRSDWTWIVACTHSHNPSHQHTAHTGHCGCREANTVQFQRWTSSFALHVNRATKHH